MFNDVLVVFSILSFCFMKILDNYLYWLCDCREGLRWGFKKVSNLDMNFCKLI